MPFVPNIAKLAEATEISRPRRYEYLENLQDARLLNLVRSQGRGYAVLTKPEKILLENSNLMYAIADDVNTGTLRELFFVNQFRNAGAIHPQLIESGVELLGLCTDDGYVKEQLPGWRAATTAGSPAGLYAGASKTLTLRLSFSVIRFSGLSLFPCFPLRLCCSASLR